MNENQLLKLKRELEESEKELQRNKGKLESQYEELCKLLNLNNNTDKTKIEKEVKKQIQKLNDKIKSEQEQLDELLNEIEQETSEWED